MGYAVLTADLRGRTRELWLYLGIPEGARLCPSQ